MSEPKRTKWSIVSLLFFLVMSAHRPDWSTLAVVSEVLDEVAALVRELTR